MQPSFASFSGLAMERAWMSPAAKSGVVPGVDEDGIHGWVDSFL
jgi:hypothetical protein